MKIDMGRTNSPLKSTPKQIGPKIFFFGASLPRKAMQRDTIPPMSPGDPLSLAPRPSGLGDVVRDRPWCLDALLKLSLRIGTLG